MDAVLEPTKQAVLDTKAMLDKAGITEQRRRTLSQKPFLRHPPAPLQSGRDAPRPGPLPLYQRPSRRHLRAEEQPHQADRRRRRGAVQARPRPARASLPSQEGR